MDNIMNATGMDVLNRLKAITARIWGGLGWEGTPRFEQDPFARPRSDAAPRRLTDESWLASTAHSVVPEPPEPRDGRPPREHYEALQAIRRRLYAAADRMDYQGRSVIQAGAPDWTRLLDWLALPEPPDWALAMRDAWMLGLWPVGVVQLRDRPALAFAPWFHAGTDEPDAPYVAVLEVLTSTGIRA